MRHSDQRFSYPIPGHLRLLDRAIEPAAHIGREFLAFKVMTQSLSEPRAQPVRRFPARILMRKIVVGKPAKHRSRDPDAVICRTKTDRAMSRRSKLVPERRLDQAMRKKLPDALVALNSLGDRFAGKPVHQIRMNKNAGAPECRAHTGGVRDRNAFLYFFKKPI